MSFATHQSPIAPGSKEREERSRLRRPSHLFWKKTLLAIVSRPMPTTRQEPTRLPTRRPVIVLVQTGSGPVMVKTMVRFKLRLINFLTGTSPEPRIRLTTN